MPSHVPRPVHVRLLVDGNEVHLRATQVSALRQFDADGVMQDRRPDSHAVRSFRHRGWVLQSRGRIVLTPQGRAVHAALIAYFERKSEALRGGASS